MPAPSKFVTIYGLLAALEASYNAGGSPSTATDGVLLEELPQYKFGYANDGARPAPPGSLGYQRRVAPSGRTGEFTPKVAPKGAGAAYSSSVKPNIHALLRLAGFDAAVTTTSGLEKWTYTPTPGPTGYASGVFSLYGRGELYPLQAGLADLTLTIDGPSVPVIECAIKGLASLPSDASVPAITYPALAIDPPKATGILFTLGNLTAGVIRKLSLKCARQIDPRLDINGGGHAGFTPGRRTPTLEVELETPALVGSPYTGASTMDPYQLYDTAAALAWSFQIGSVQYNRHLWSGPAAQLMKEPELAADGATAITKLSFQLNPSALNANDELSIVFS